jgi:hypothetical protein
MTGRLALKRRATLRGRALGGAPKGAQRYFQGADGEGEGAGGGASGEDQVRPCAALHSMLQPLWSSLWCGALRYRRAALYLLSSSSIVFVSRIGE